MANGYVANAALGLGALLDYLQVQQANRRNAGYRQEALNYLDTADLDAPTLNELMTSGMFDDQPSAIFNPDSMTRAVMGLQGRFRGAMGDAYDEFGSQLELGLDDSRQNLDEGLGGLRDITQRGVDDLSGRRLTLGSTFGLLDLDDPEERFREALTFGDEAAAANQEAGLQSVVDNNFGEMARLGVDPFEAGAFGDTRRQLTDRRFNDLFASRAAAAGERNRIQEFNVRARQGALESEQATNRNIDSAIAALYNQEVGSAGDLYGTRMVTDAGLRTDMLGNLFDRQTSLEGTYVPQIAGMETEIARLTQQGRIDEANRLRENLAMAQGIRMDEVGANQSEAAQRLAVLLHDPQIMLMFQELLANMPALQGG